jgi:hypothetical protein
LPAAPAVHRARARDDGRAEEDPDAGGDPTNPDVPNAGVVVGGTVTGSVVGSARDLNQITGRIRPTAGERIGRNRPLLTPGPAHRRPGHAAPRVQSQRGARSVAHRRNHMFKRSLFVSLSVTLLAFASSGLAHAGAVTQVPCAAKAKAVIANTGSSMHNSGSTVQGDVQAATSIIKNGNPTITGTQTPNTPAHLAVVPVPAEVVNLGNYVVSGTVTLAAGNYVASSFSMNGGATLKVTGGVAQIWVTGSTALTGTANAGGDPTNLEILVTGTQGVNVNSNTSFTGFIYAPTAPVLVNSNAVVNGSIVGSNTTLNSGGKVVFVPSAVCP